MTVSGNFSQLRRTEIVLTCGAALFAALAAHAQPGASPRHKVERFVAALDLNRDGCISRQEWLSASLDPASYGTLDARATGRDCVTVVELLRENYPQGMDSNGDGSLSVAEFRTYRIGHPAPGTREPAVSAGPGKCPPYTDGRKADASPLVDAIDTNCDGQMTHAEWLAAAAPEPSWQMFMTKPKVRSQGYISRQDFLSDTPPDGIDTNCDGKISLQEFLATKRWSRPASPPASKAQSSRQNR